MSKYDGKKNNTREAPALELEKYDKSNHVVTNSQQNAKNGFIEGVKILTDLFPLISGITIVSIVIAQMYYANSAEQYYHIEKSLFFTEIIYDKLLKVGEFAILNLSFLLLSVIMYKVNRDIHLVLYIVIFLLSSAVFAIGLYTYAVSVLQGIYPADDGNRIILCILKYPLVFILLLSFLGTLGFGIMLDNIVLSHIVQKIQTLINRLYNKDKKAKETGKGECKQPKKITNNILGILCTIICVLSAMAIIGVWVVSFILGGIIIIHRENYPQKKTYEIVQNNNCPELNVTLEQVSSVSNFQVVVLHRGSQVLLMNGEIDGQKIINPQEDITSSSNLVIDTSSYEFQEASQYRFYRKTFNTVKTNDTKKQD